MRIWTKEGYEYIDEKRQTSHTSSVQKEKEKEIAIERIMKYKAEKI